MQKKASESFSLWNINVNTNDNSVHSFDLRASRQFFTHNPVLWLAANGGSRALIGAAMMGPRPRRDLESRLWPFCVSQAAPDYGSVSEIISPALNIFMWERDLATWSREWREWVRFAGQGKCFSVFKLEAVSCVWSDIGPVSESAIIIRWLCHTSRAWSSKPR